MNYECLRIYNTVKAINVVKFGILQSYEIYMQWYMSVTQFKNSNTKPMFLNYYLEVTCEKLFNQDNTPSPPPPPMQESLGKC